MNWIEVQAHMERYNDLRRDVEHERLVRQALAEREGHGRIHSPAMMWTWQKAKTLKRILWSVKARNSRQPTDWSRHLSRKSS
jgi:hypothetical protein